jgi:Photosynthetic reaction centre cytochrome C subunit
MRLWSLCAFVSLWLSPTLATAAQQRPQLAEDVFKNIQVLRGIPVDEFMETMGFFSSSLGLNCVDCHTRQSEGNWARYGDDTPLKNTTRRMVRMVDALNRANFGGVSAITCWTCHRGDQRPKVVPSLVVQYSAPAEDPNETEGDTRDTAAVDRVFAKYIQAIGGAERVAALKSFSATGTYSGYDTDQQPMPVEIFATAPAQRTTIVHMALDGQTLDSVRTYDGKEGWIASPDKPVPLMTLTGGNLQGARIEAMALFPAQLRQAFTRWKTASASIDDRDVQVLEGSAPGQLPVKLFFDADSGLLIRLLHYSASPVGRTPTQIDYATYREVSGVKLPFRWTTTWTGGQSITELKDVRSNLDIPVEKFSRPAPASMPGVVR